MRAQLDCIGIARWRQLSIVSLFDNRHQPAIFKVDGELWRSASRFQKGECIFSVLSGVHRVTLCTTMYNRCASTLQVCAIQRHWCNGRLDHRYIKTCAKTCLRFARAKSQDASKGGKGESRIIPAASDKIPWIIRSVSISLYYFYIITQH